MKNFIFLQQKYAVNTYVNRQLTLVNGSGVFLFDEKGEKYLDLMSNYGVSIFGYHHQTVTAALAGQLQQLTTLHGSFTNDVRAEVSEQLVNRCGSGYKQVYWSNSGAEAIEASLKFAVLASGKQKFIVCKRGYHGKTLGALSATAGEKYKKPFRPLLWDFTEIPFNDPIALKNAIDRNTAGFIVEPIQGEGGIYVPDPGYLQRVRKICSDRKILLIIDEIQTGTGRTGSFLASQKEHVFADILCLGKGLAGGIPIGATLISREVAAAIPQHIHTSTFGGNPLACAGVLVTLDLLNAECLNHVKSIGKYFTKQLALLRSEFISEVRGEGLLVGMAVKDKRNQMLKLLQKSHVLAIPSGDDVIRFLPPYIIQKEEINTAIKALRKIVTELS